MGTTFVVGDKLMGFEEQVQSGPVSQLCVIVAVIDMEPKSDIRQNCGIFIDFMDCEHQGQDVLVEFGDHSADRVT